MTAYTIDATEMQVEADVLRRPGLDRRQFMPPADVPLHLRLPRDLVERADRLVDIIANRPDALVLGRPSRSSVLRAALVAGLEELERRFTSSPG